MNLTRYGRMTVIVVIGIFVLAVVACRGDQTSSTPAGGPFTGSPTAAPALMGSQEEIEISITDGTFDTREIRLVADVATIMHITNNDDQDYVLRIGDLVVGEDIPAGQTTEINFTTPVASEYQAELLDGPGGEILDTVLVSVDPAGT
jgi:hypothetical protein